MPKDTSSVVREKLKHDFETSNKVHLQFFKLNDRFWLRRWRPADARHNIPPQLSQLETVSRFCNVLDLVDWKPFGMSLQASTRSSSVPINGSPRA
jgi:hypothetical protein